MLDEENLNYETTQTHMCYDDLQVNCDTCCILYGYTVADGICPDGWHVPTKAELYKMINYLGGSKPAKDKMLAGGSSGFNLKKCGKKEGAFYLALGTSAYILGDNGPLGLLPTQDSVRYYTHLKIFASCRCLKDE